MPWCPDISSTDLAYIAGIVDGEGCIYASWRYKNKSYQDHVKMTVAFICNMTDKNVLEFIASRFNLKIYDGRGTKRKAYRIYIAGAKQLNLFLIPLLPYLVGKKHIAELALKVIETFNERGKREVSELNVEKRQKYWNILRYANHFNPANKITVYPGERCFN